MTIRIYGIRPLFWPTIFSLPALLILLGLSAWQIERREEKRALLDEISQRLNAPVQPVPARIDDPAALKFRHMEATGRFHHEHEFHLLANTEDGKQGYQIITPLERGDGSYVLVNRGWVPGERREAATRVEGQISDEVTITGLVRTPWAQGWFVPDNAPKANFWFYGDLDGMAKAAGLTNYAPVFLDADRTPNPGGLPIGGQTRLTFPNDHLQYAITWFLLAVALVAVYVLYHRSKAMEET